jgi:hypothetical protein
VSPDGTTVALVMWLRARLDERVADATAALVEARGHWPASEFTIEWQWACLTRHDARGIAGLHCAPGAPRPEHVLADVVARRRVLDAYGWAVRDVEHSTDAEDPRATALNLGRMLAYDDAVRCVGASYAGHPDYRQEWLP